MGRRFASGLVEGANQAFQEFSDIELILYGDTRSLTASELALSTQMKRLPLMMSQPRPFVKKKNSSMV